MKRSSTFLIALTVVLLVFPSLLNAGWEVFWTGTKVDDLPYLEAVWGSSESDVFAAGKGYGGVVHFDGSDWIEMSGITYRRFTDIWGSSGSDVFAVRSWNMDNPGNLISHFDGSNWTSTYLSFLHYRTSLYGVWGSSGPDVFALEGSSYGGVLHYHPENLTLTVNRAGSGSGRILSSPAGIDCGTNCTNTFREDSVVILSAEPDSGSIFKNWEGGACTGRRDCVLPMYQDELVTANFAQVYTITAKAGEKGTISPSGNLVVEQGSSLTFSIIPLSGYYVSSLVVDGRSIDNPSAISYSFENVTSDHTISVSFDRNWETFETGDLSAFPWATSGDGVWRVQNTVVFSGNASIQAPVSIGHNQTSSLRVTLCIEIEMDISFWFKVSSEVGYDYLTFKIDKVEKGRWSGEIEWTKASYPISPGRHTFTWRYTKDAEVSKGSDTCWIDNVMFPKGEPCAAKGMFYIIPNKDGGGAVIYLES